MKRVREFWIDEKDIFSDNYHEGLLYEDARKDMIHLREVIVEAPSKQVTEKQQRNIDWDALETEYVKITGKNLYTITLKKLLDQQLAKGK